MRLLLLAIRNLGRNFRRTMITALAVLFGVAAIVVLQGFVNGFIRMAIEGVVLARVAPLQVHRKGYIGADDPLKLHFAHRPALSNRLRAVPGVTAVAPRVTFEGMLSNGSEATIFVGTAIDPENEYRVCPLRKTHVGAGSRPLEPGGSTSALVGKVLADALGARRGDSLVMQAAGPTSGGTNALDVEVAGFLPTVSLLESKRMALVTLPFAQRLLRMEGEVTEYAVGIANLDDADAVAERLRAALGGDYEVHTWRQLSVDIDTRIKSMKWVFGFVALVLFLLVATGIVNTMMMSVHERVREIGTMLAVGLRRRQITALFLEEAVALGAIGAAVGAVVGSLLVAWLAARGVPFSPPGGDPAIVHPAVAARFLAGTIAFAVGGTVLSALYPAWRAARLNPVDALRSI